MVERYDTYYGSIACRSTGREIRPDGEHVSATDYAALEAERDEWKRRCESIVAEMDSWGTLPNLTERLAAIAEGRDNG